MAKTLDISLSLVVPLHSHLCAADCSEKHVAEIVFRKELLLFVCEVPRISSALLKPHSVVMSPPCRHRKGLVAAVQHKSCNLLDAQLSRKISRPVLETSSPVLIHIKAVISVQVLECKSVHCQDLDSRLFRISQRRSILLGDEYISVFLLFCPLRRCCT